MARVPLFDTLFDINMMQSATEIENLRRLRKKVTSIKVPHFTEFADASTTQMTPRNYSNNWIRVLLDDIKIYLSVYKKGQPLMGTIKWGDVETKLEAISKVGYSTDIYANLEFFYKDKFVKLPPMKYNKRYIKNFLLEHGSGLEDAIESGDKGMVAQNCLDELETSIAVEDYNLKLTGDDLGKFIRNVLWSIRLGMITNDKRNGLNMYFFDDFTQGLGVTTNFDEGEQSDNQGTDYNFEGLRLVDCFDTIAKEC